MTLSRHFGRATPKRVTEVQEILDTLVLMGQAKLEGELCGDVRSNSQAGLIKKVDRIESLDSIDFLDPFDSPPPSS